MDTSPLLILLICALVAVTFVAIACFRSGRSKLRRDQGVPIGFGMDASPNNSDIPAANQRLHHHHHHHHSTPGGGHHHSHGGTDSGGSHHGGGSDGGGGVGGHH